jgi:hypothetical protein
MQETDGVKIRSWQRPPDITFYVAMMRRASAVRKPEKLLNDKYDHTSPNIT